MFAGLLIGLVTLISLPAQTQYERGPRGGCYEVTKDGKKSVKRSLCDSTATSQAKSTDSTPTSAPSSQTQADTTKKSSTAASGTQATANPPAQKIKDGKTYVTGPKGGCYYVTASGRKQYVDHSMCR